MYLTPGRGRGFTVVELMITVTVLATLSVLGMPTMTAAINNAKVRSAAEALQNGLRSAQSEAIRRSHQTAFALTNDNPDMSAAPVADGRYWYARVLPVVPGETLDDPYLQGGQFGDQASGVTITGPAAICFNSIGRVVTNNTTTLPGGEDCTAPSPRVAFNVTHAGADRTLQLQVNAAGKIRMCDRSRILSASQPDGC